MLTPGEIRTKAEKRLGSFLTADFCGEPFFPLVIPFGALRSVNHYERDKTAIEALLVGSKEATGSGYEVEWDWVDTRVFSRQRLPRRVFFSNEGDYLACIGRTRDATRFRDLASLIRRECPELEAWIARYPLRVLALAELWPNLLRVCRYFAQNPRPERYARELPIAVPTKFIEEHRGALTELLPIAAPAGYLSQGETFESRFGLKAKESAWVRFRFLDEKLREEMRFPAREASLPSGEFARLSFPACTCVISENEMTYLTLPSLPRAFGIFGAGNAAQTLHAAPNLKQCRLIYWGDLDVHGFHILNRLRATFQVTSVMMDVETLAEFRDFVVPANPATHQSIDSLSVNERAIYEELRALNQLLEQERVAHSYAVTRLQVALEAN